MPLNCQRLGRQNTHPHGGPHCRAVALLIWLLSRDCKLAALYLNQTARTEGDGAKSLLEVGDDELAVMLLSYLKDASVCALLEQAVDDPEHKLRMQADTWLMKELLVEFIVKANNRGLAVQPGAIIATYLRYWSYRPTPVAIQEGLVKLTYCSSARKYFLRRLRSEWGLKTGPLNPCRTLSAEDTSNAVDETALCHAFELSRDMTG